MSATSANKLARSCKGFFSNFVSNNKIIEPSRAATLVQLPSRIGRAPPESSAYPARSAASTRFAPVTTSSQLAHAMAQWFLNYKQNLMRQRILQHSGG